MKAQSNVREKIVNMGSINSLATTRHRLSIGLDAASHHGKEEKRRKKNKERKEVPMDHQ